jgi:hypothetical protein
VAGQGSGNDPQTASIGLQGGMAATLLNLSQKLKELLSSQAPCLRNYFEQESSLYLTMSSDTDGALVFESIMWPPLRLLLGCSIL